MCDYHGMSQRVVTSSGLHDIELSLGPFLKNYFNGILYNLKELGDIDKFGVFCGAHLNYLTEQNFYDALVKADIVLSAETLSSGDKFYNYNQSYDMKLYNKENNIVQIL